MLYLDTSSLLKTVFAEPESEAVDAVLAGEDAVVITPLAELEALVQVRAHWLAGALTQAKYRRLLEMLESLKQIDPFAFHELPSAIFGVALRQHRAAERIHCRSLDRLHLAAMEELGVTRLMTHDSRQSEGARALGFEVITP